MTRAAARAALSFLYLSCVSAGAMAQTAVAGPYYATPSWDQTLPAATRFLVLSNFSNQAVLDRETGLVWQRSPLTPLMINTNAYFYCAGSSVGGRFGWRLPTLVEVTSVLDPNATTAPPFAAGHPFTGFEGSGRQYIQTATQAAPLTVVGLHYAPSFRIEDGHLVISANEYHGDLALGFAWCVRGGDSGVQ